MSHGDFVWYELMTTDAKSAEAFYRDVVGWGAKDAGMSGTSYTLFTVGDAPVAGLMALNDQALKAGARPGWVGYVAVDNVDDSAARVKAAGGNIHHGPEDIPGVGRFAFVADPQGAMISLFKPAADSGRPALARGTPSTTGWHELYAGDGAKAFAFYADLFGWKKADAVDMGSMGIYQLFANGNEPIGGMMTKPPNIPVSAWTYYFNVDGIDAAAARVKASKGQIINGPMEVPGGSFIVQGLDPQGVMFALVSAKR